jgi:hypothetical protein
LTVESGKLAQLERLNKTAGLRRLLHEPPGHVASLGFVTARCPNEEALREARPRVEVELAPGERTGFTVVGVLPRGAALVHVTQHDGRRIVGGLSAAVVSRAVEAAKESREREQ